MMKQTDDCCGILSCHYDYDIVNCQCIDPNDPCPSGKCCYIEECKPGFKFDPKTCKCKCNKDPSSCQGNFCWNQECCECECPLKICPNGFEPNPEICLCECVRECGPGEILDEFCCCKCEVTSCPEANEVLNPSGCGCMCLEVECADGQYFDDTLGECCCKPKESYYPWKKKNKKCKP